MGLVPAAFVTFTAAPEYRAKAQIFFSTPGSSLDVAALATRSNFSQQRVRSHSQIISSPATLELVIDQPKLQITSQKL